MELKKIIFIVPLFFTFQFTQCLFAQERIFTACSIAAFDVIQQHEPSVEGRLELRLEKSDWKFNPFIGVMANADEARHVYLGIYKEMIFLKNLIFSPSFAPGFYFKGNSKDLSFVLEFRSQLELSYRFENSMKIGVSLNHISNAGIKPPNIGVESLAFTFIFPVG